MFFIKTKFSNVFILEPDRKEDARGHFSRAYCTIEFENNGINIGFVQDDLSFNHKMNTIRGMHFQRPPFGEDKIVRCIAGKIFDVIVDMIKESSMYLQWFGLELSAKKENMIFIPKGFAHGYQTLTDNTAVYYKVSEFYNPEASCGIYFNEPNFGIKWKNIESELIISEQDKGWNPI